MPNWNFISEAGYSIYDPYFTQQANANSGRRASNARRSSNSRHGSDRYDLTSDYIRAQSGGHGTASSSSQQCRRRNSARNQQSETTDPFAWMYSSNVMDSCPTDYNSSRRRSSAAQRRSRSPERERRTSSAHRRTSRSQQYAAEADPELLYGYDATSCGPSREDRAARCQFQRVYSTHPDAIRQRIRAHQAREQLARERSCRSQYRYTYLYEADC